MASLQCVCQSVEIVLSSPPVQRFLCCCCDCRRGLSWCTEQGGPSQPAVPGVPDLVYFPNELAVSRGANKLAAFVLREGYPTKRIVATCCWTALLGDHPAYASERLVTYNQPGVLQLQGDIPLRPPDARIFVGDMSDEELKALPSFVPPADGEGTTWAAASAAARAALATPSIGTESVQSLIARIGVVKTADPGWSGPLPQWLRQK
eukprot:gnl/TRDRNA2_/TRDRNA2_174788_c1_seq4.p1 gnl/TRDRNA2_/TRDRNA2_174788_c1~~gnl/TRDRNA2_/TRDRNA2_174788_c1_seq4.p1  ORF type:complete len:206 (+),score=25.86 gnl/TRDRNA2_/TRDRNA2_174788_c1_seq4:47-664(+)